MAKSNCIYLHTVNNGAAWNRVFNVQICVYLCQKNGVKHAKIMLHPPKFVSRSRIRQHFTSRRYAKKYTDHNFYRVLERDKCVHINAHGINIEITIEKTKLFDLAMLIVRSFTWSSTKYLKTRFGSRDFVGDFLSMELENLKIGKHSAAIALRGDEKCGGRLAFSRRKFLSLLDCRTVYEYVKKVKLPIDAKHYFSVEDEAYHGGVYEQLFYRKGCTIVSLNSPTTRFKIVDSQVELESPRQVPRSSSALSNSEVAQCEEYMLKRFEDPVGALPYMQVGANHSKYFSNETLDKIKAEDFLSSENKVNAVVFLHAFSDAQFIFGLDGFDDQYEWTFQTIRKLQENIAVKRILLKPHPNIDLQYYVADHRAINNLRALLPSEKIVWIDPKINLTALTEIKGFVGITHHGSVAEEISFLAKPVIASTFSPWGRAFDFCCNWSSVEEYFNILANIQDVSNGILSNSKARKELYHYLRDARINAPNKNSMYQDLLERINAGKIRSNTEKLRKLNEMLEAHEGNDLTELIPQP